MSLKKHLLSLLIFLCPAGIAMAADAPAVVVSIKPIHALVAGVMQGVAEPELLVKGGGSPHGYSLRPSEARALAEADLVVWVGPQLESFLVKPLETLAHQAHQLELLEAIEGPLLALRKGGAWEGHAHGHEAEHQGHETEHQDHEAEHQDHEAEHQDHEAEHQDHEAEHQGHEAEHQGHEAEHQDHEAEHQDHDADHQGHEMEAVNTHIWLSPLLAKQIVAHTAQTLSELDPENQPRYTQNAARLQGRLEELHQELNQKLAPVKNIPYVVFHDAYQYFEDTYGLNVVGSITLDAERSPGAKRIIAIRDKIVTLEARAVFSEPQFESRLVDTVIEGTGARTGVLDPLGSKLPAGPESYFQLLNNLVDNLLAGLEGASQD